MGRGVPVKQFPRADGLLALSVQISTVLAELLTSSA
jgi:hypothetical protein